MAVPFRTITAEDDDIEDRVSERLDALSPAAEFARQAEESAALTLALYGGISPLTGNDVAASSRTLTGSATNYVKLNDDDSITVHTSAPAGWPYSMSGAWAIGVGVAGSSTYTWTDMRRIGGATKAAILAALGLADLTITKAGNDTGTFVTISVLDSDDVVRSTQIGPLEA